MEAWFLRARCALASAANINLSAREQVTFLRSAERDARSIEGVGIPWAHPLARLVRAGIAANRLDRRRACDLLSSAEADLARHDLALYAAAARRRRGELVGGEEGAALVADADAWMAGQDIKNPARMADMLAPGRWN